MPGKRKNSTPSTDGAAAGPSSSPSKGTRKSSKSSASTRRKSSIHFMPNEDLQKCVQTLLYTSKLLFPKYPAHYFPLHTFAEYMKHFKRIVRNNRFKVRPMPDHLFDYMVTNQNGDEDTIYSDHTVFVPDRIYKKLVVQDHLNWIQLTILLSSSSSPDDSLAVLRGASNPKLIVPVVRMKNCQNASVFVKESIFENFISKLNLSGFKALDCELNRFDLKENDIPELITSASIMVVNHPYDLPNDLLDHILRCYFTKPRYLFTNFTYSIHLNEALIGNHFYSRYHNLFANLRTLHIRCIKLESKTNKFEIHGILFKGLTVLKEVPSKDLQLPSRHLHSLAFANIVPDGLQSYFKKILADTMPFIVSERNAVFAKNKIFPVFMIHGTRGSGKAFLVDALAGYLGYHLYRVDCNEVMGQVAAHTETKLNVIFAKYKRCQPMIIWWDNFEVFGVDNEGNEDSRLLSSFQQEVQELYSSKDEIKVIIVVTSNTTEVKPFLQRLFLDTIEIQTPNQAERLSNLRWIYTVEQARDTVLNSEHIFDTIQAYSTRTSVMRKQTFTALSGIAEQSQGFGFEDLRLLFTKTNQSRRLRDKGVALCGKDFEGHLVEMEKSFGESFGAPKVPKVLWSDIGGLWKLKDEIQNSIGLPLKHFHLMGKSMRRSGILLYGPPGTGKTLVAKAVATECNLNFLAVQGPELLNMYVGQSEQNVREIFARARAAAPCVIFLDELDSLAPNRGVAGDSGGVMDRVVSQLLAEMDGLTTNKENLFILAATNRPDLIDPALLRPGRFDKLLYVGPCVNQEDKKSVLEAQTKKFYLETGLQLDEVVKLLTMDLTGADMYSVCSNAWLVAVRRIVAEHKKKANTKDDSLKAKDVTVNLEDFKSALQKFVPSINAKDMEYFNRLKSSFS